MDRDSACGLGVVGYGTVGRRITRLLRRSGFKVEIYDCSIDAWSSPVQRDKVNATSLAFIAVPTPSRPDGAADVSHVEQVLEWLRVPGCIKSTVPPGTTNSLQERYQIDLAHSPEYVGETPFHPYRQEYCPDVVIVGGKGIAAKRTLEVMRKCLGPYPSYFKTDPTTSELAKYMENCFFATKLAFLAQFTEIAERYGCDPEELREMWVSDQRVGKSHSIVIDQPGFGGRCLPKDLAAIIAAVGEDNASLLTAVREVNQRARLPISAQE